MIQFPKSTHPLYHFESEGRFYVADMHRSQIVELDSLTREVLRLGVNHTNDQIIEELMGGYGEEDIIESFEKLQELEKEGLLFHRGEETQRLVSRKEKRFKFLIVDDTRAWYTDIEQLTAGTHMALHYMVKHLTKYAEIHQTGRETKPLAEGVYQIDFSIRDIIRAPWKLQEGMYDGILALHYRTIYSLLPLFRIPALPPILVEIHVPRGHSGLEVNSILLHYAAMRDFDTFTVPSDYVAKYYSRFVRDISFFRTLPNGVESDVFKPMDKQLAKREVAAIVGDNRITEKTTVGYLSRIQPEKGISVYWKLAEMIPDALFLLAGPSLGPHALRELPNNLIYVGYQAREKLPLVYNTFDIYCFPSMSAEETFGLTVLEAMACGVPPIVPHFSGMPDVVGDAGLIADAENFDMGSYEKLLIGLGTVFCIYAVYTDLRQHKIPNLCTVCLIYTGLLSQVIWLLLGRTNLSNLLTIFFVGGLMTLGTFWIDLLAPGDAKLVWGLSLLLPPSLFRSPVVRGSLAPLLSLAVNTFVPFFILLTGYLLVKSTSQQKKQALAAALKWGQLRQAVLRLVDFISFALLMNYGFSRIPDAFPFEFPSWLQVLLILGIYAILRHLLASRESGQSPFRGILSLPALALLAITTPSLLQSWQTVALYFAVYFLCYGGVLSVLLQLRHLVLDSPVKVWNLKPGMVAAEQLVKVQSGADVVTYEKRPLETQPGEAGETPFIGGKHAKLSREQIRVLQQLAREGHLKAFNNELMISHTMPFAPAIAFGFLLTAWLGSPFPWWLR